MLSPSVTAAMARQRGLVLRRQLVDSGLGVDDITRKVRTGALVAVRRGVYTAPDVWAAADVRRGRPLLRAYAASLNMSVPHLLSHESAALAHGMDIMRAESELVHITRFGVQGCRKRHGVCHHLAPFEPWQIVEVDGVPMLDRARTALDIARNHGQTGLAFGVVACDSALRLGTRRHELDAALTPMRCWPNVTVAREAVELSDAGSDSVAESLGRLVLAGLGVGPVQTQFGLRDGDREAWVDLRVGRHLVEVDGKVKYQRDGLADRPAEEVVWREKKRQDWICALGFGMSRLVWADLVPERRAITSARLLREIESTRRRFGDDLADVSAYVVTGPRPRHCRAS
jgi:hypothetical protein